MGRMGVGMPSALRGAAGRFPWPQLLLVSMLLLSARQDARVAETPPLAASDAATVAMAKRVPPLSRPVPGTRAITDSDAARFLTQATFGPTLSEIAYLRQVGYAAWLGEQFAMPASYQTPYLDAAAPDPGPFTRMEAWFRHALGGQDPFVPAIVHRDQLRQRVAFALSEIFVVSDRNDALYQQPYGMAGYYDVLVRNSFGNYRQLLEEVTLHPAMGLYLSMMGNMKPDPVRNVRPDENYAREVLQLFSIGLVRLNPDGTPMRDAMGRTIPTYDQFTVKGFAHVFTGWNFADCPYYEGCWFNDYTAPSWRVPMVAYPAHHDTAGSKQLLDYPGVALPAGVLGPGGTAPGNLDAALDNIFRHPNVGPFIARQLIQRLVTSNPRPEYVARVAARFDDNGAGVRGDLRAVIQAILFDTEARLPSLPGSGRVREPHPRFGKVREPLLRLTHLWRALDAGANNGRTTEWAPEEYLGQAPLRAPSVFNFFSPSYQPVGEPTALGLFAPELQLATGFQLPITSDAYGDNVFRWYVGSPQGTVRSIRVDLGRDAPLAANPAALLDRYDLLFMSGQMSSRMRQLLLAHLQGVPNTNGGRDRVQEALYLIVNSPEYTVQK